MEVSKSITTDIIIVCGACVLESVFKFEREMGGKFAVILAQREESFRVRSVIKGVASPEIER